MVLVGATVILSMIVLGSALSVTDDARGATTWNVNISGFAFNPPTLPIAVGDTVVWTNNDGTPHTVTSTDGSGELDSGDIANGGTYSHQFNTIDTFTYRCELHPSMTGSVTVSTVIPEFSNMPFIILGILGMVAGLMAIRRRI